MSVSDFPLQGRVFLVRDFKTPYELIVVPGYETIVICEGHTVSLHLVEVVVEGRGQTGGHDGQFVGFANFNNNNLMEIIINK